MALFLVLFLAFPPCAHAVRPDEMLQDPKLEARARDISRDLRCLVCQNESIDDSDADLAHDLRVLVRKRLEAGDTDAEAKRYLVDRYGDYVLLKPPLKPSTLALWFGPVALLLAGAGCAAAFFRRRASAPDPGRPLTKDDAGRVADILKGKKP